ncbi:lachesin isoform X2 [Thrips palmi]|uniref:Lachesin isoform X2 n=1 Tax=Thrips palmi TaxID=161013 RepID=A0A6P9A8P6_THRPL|nr:lachesin isoform X2 [Thrips palmi]
MLPLLLLTVPAVALTDSAAQDLPKFVGSLNNVTIAVGREALLTCVVENLSNYKVAWLQVDTQTILTIHGSVITKNHRIKVTQTDQRTWQLHIRDVRETDRGYYMCQLNTDPMKSQQGYLEVVVPPNILDDYHTSTDMVEREGHNVSMRCEATGSPPPVIIWRREDGKNIKLGNGLEESSFEGSLLTIHRVDRLSMGAYLCIASNGVPPSVSKRLKLIVHFPPMITIPNQLVGAVQGQNLTLECISEAFPKSINYWTRNGEIVTAGPRHEPTVYDKDYTITMRLHIRNVQKIDFNSYKCVSKNNLGETDGLIQVEEILQPSTPMTTSRPSHSTHRKGKKGTRKESRNDNEVHPENDNTSEKYRGDLKRTDADLTARGGAHSKAAFSSGTPRTSQFLNGIALSLISSVSLVVLRCSI